MLAFLLEMAREEGRAELTGLSITSALAASPKHWPHSALIRAALKSRLSPTGKRDRRKSGRMSRQDVSARRRGPLHRAMEEYPLASKSGFVRPTARAPLWSHQP